MPELISGLNSLPGLKSLPELNSIQNNTRKFKYNRNILPDFMERNLILGRHDPFLKHLKAQANFICRNHINEDYIKKAFNNFTGGFYYKDTNMDSLVAFCLFRERKELVMTSDKDMDYLDILLICAHDYKIGKAILVNVEGWALNKGVHRIQLQPVNNTIVPYYESSGYKILDGRPNVVMEKTARAFIIKHKNKSNMRKLRKTMKISQNK